MKNYIVEDIMYEYKKKKKYERKIEIQKFQKENCINCKNKDSNKCHITRNINKKLMCAFYEI